MVRLSVGTCMDLLDIKTNTQTVLTFPNRVYGSRRFFSGQRRACSLLSPVSRPIKRCRQAAPSTTHLSQLSQMIHRFPPRRRRSPFLPRTPPIRRRLHLTPTRASTPAPSASSHPAPVETTSPPGGSFRIIPGEHAFEGRVCGFWKRGGSLSGSQDVDLSEELLQLLLLPPLLLRQAGSFVTAMAARRKEGRGNVVETNANKEGGVLMSWHGRSRMTRDPRIPAMSGRCTSGFHRPRRQCLHQARGAVGCWTCRMKGERHPTTATTACEADLHTDGSFERNNLFSGVATFRDSNGYTMYLPRGCLIIYRYRYILPVRDTIRSFHLCEVKVLHPTKNDPTRPPVVVTAKKKKETLVV